MTSARKCVVILILFFAGFSNCIDVEVSGEWQNGLGWLINCNWTIPPSDRLHSVRLYSTLLTQTDNLFMFYRPEIHGLKYTKPLNAKDFSIKVDCYQTDRNSYDGQCTILIEPKQPPNDTMIRCEVSGERPKFNEGRAYYVAKAFVPPTEAKFENVNVIKDPIRAVFNCTAQGIPAPDLIWNVGESLNNRVNADFTERYWNTSSKIWYTWSTLNFAPQYGEDMQVSCTPEVRRGNSTERGTPAVFNSGFKSTVKMLLLIAAVTIALLR